MARILGQHTARITALEFSPDSSLLATMGSDGSIQLWKTGTWTPAGPLLAGALRDAVGLRFDGTFSRLLAWSGDGTMELWNIRSREKQDITAFISGSAYDWFRDPLPQAALNGDGSLIAFGTDKLLAIWDVKHKILRRAPIALGDKGVGGVYFRPGGDLLVVQVRGLRVSVWDVANGKITLGPDTKLWLTWPISFSRTGNRFALGEHPYTGRVFEIGRGLATMELKVNSTLKTNVHVFEATTIDASGKFLFAYHNDDWQKWEVSSTLALIEQGFLTPYSIPTWSPDGRWRAESVRKLDRGPGERPTTEKILVWDQDSIRTSGPARKIETCDFENDHSGCVQRLCEKILPSLDEEQLRKLFSIEDYQVMYDRYKLTINGSLCDHR